MIVFSNVVFLVCVLGAEVQPSDLYNFEGFQACPGGTTASPQTHPATLSTTVPSQLPGTTSNILVQNYIYLICISFLRVKPSNLHCDSSDLAGGSSCGCYGYLLDQAPSFHAA